MIPEATYYMGWVVQPIGPGQFSIYPRLDMPKPVHIVVQGRIEDAWETIERLIGRK